MRMSIDKALSRVLNWVVSSDNLDSLINKACRELTAVEGFERVSIALFDSEHNYFIEREVCESRDGKTSCDISEKRHIPYSEENLLGQAIIHSLPYAHVESDDPPMSEVVVPLSSRDNLIGVLSITSGRKGFFKEDALEKLTDYGRVLSVAIENRILSSSGHDFCDQDTLTGLYTQRYFQSRIAQEINRVDRFGSRFSLAILEIDNFAAFRKEHGHQVTSATLKEISRRMTEDLRDVDVAARYGEKEFAVLLPEADQERALHVAVRLQEIVRKTTLPGSENQSAQLTASVGMAVYPNDSSFRDGLLEAADMALARAKQGGKDQFYTYGDLAKEQGILNKD